VVVWPEGALPAVIDDLLAPGSPYVDRLGAGLRPGQTLMMGANRVGPGPRGGVAYYNSLIAFRREGPAAGGGLRVTGVYDKHRLVPFGEFLPLGAIATKWGIRSLVHMPEDFTAGADPKPLRPAGLPAVQPLICYEALFPRFTSDAARRGGLRPAWILNVSNDAWFGATSGPWQHLNIAGYRAIEEGLPLARATPTGVTAMIDAHGRVVDGRRLALGRQGVIDLRLPRALPPTLYSRFGEIFFATMLFSSVLIPVIRRVRRGATSTTG
jgi:apolipoprotein N-acyltransferase